MSHPLLLHSVSYAGLWGQAYLPLEQVIAKAAELGYDGVMLMAKRPHLSPLDYGKAERARLRQLLEKHKVGAVVLAAYCNFTADLEHGEVPHREIQTAYLAELALLAREVGAGAIRVFTGYESAACDYTRQWRMIADALRECAGRAAEHGVVLAVQNHHDIGAGTEAFADLLRAVDHPNCRAAFDAWAPALQGSDYLAGARQLGGITVHTTIADYRRLPRYVYQPTLVNYEARTPVVQAVPMGEGFIDYRGFLAALAEGGFSGSIAYEMCSPLRDGASLDILDAYARRFLDYARAAGWSSRSCSR
jgi:sugar phosphate isomerase/epimerase